MDLGEGVEIHVIPRFYSWYRCGTGCVTVGMDGMNQKYFDKSLDRVPKLLQIKSLQALMGIK